MGNSRRVFGLFAKWPKVGQVKTRLAAATSALLAAEAAMAFLRDLTERLSRLEARRVLVFAPPDAGPLFSEVVGDRFQLVSQADGDLGVRLFSFMSAELTAGADSVVVLGSDSPTVPLEYIDRAFAELKQADVVLGPATDGGYYLLGCGRRLPPIFDGIAWGTSAVLAQTIARLTEAGGHLALLPPWYDVDTRDDWQLLRGHLAALRRAGIDPGVPHTEALCRSELP